MKNFLTNQHLKTKTTDPDYLRDPSGCTAVTVLVSEDWRVLCGNAGDSRAVLSRKGVAVPLSFDHKPVNPGKRPSARIRNAGGFVEFGRVNGNLALSRAVGDFEFKQNKSLPAEEQIVTVNPDIEEKQLVLDEDEFFVLACDDGATLAQISEVIMDHCLADDSDLGAYGCDNMTVVVVGILNGRTQEEWYALVRERFLAEKAAGAVPPPPLNGARTAAPASQMLVRVADDDDDDDEALRADRDAAGEEVAAKAK
ncbi:Protein phosphatase 2C 2 [Cladochytrium tenue]|nr:Protein phosphatase 2C 2 [Cladochytrium tenue]